MEITWYGLSCFSLVERGYGSVVTDPYDHRVTGYSPLKLTADIVTISHEGPEFSYVESVKGSPHVINGPGEYEVGGVFITAIQTGGQKGSDHSYNTLYVFDFDALTVAHLGDLSRTPTQAEVEAIGAVNIALVPVGGGLNAARAVEVINLLDPNIVIPMHYPTAGPNASLDSLNKFLKEMGVSEVRTQPSLKVQKTGLPEETQVVVLEDHQR